MYLIRREHLPKFRQLPEYEHLCGKIFSIDQNPTIEQVQECVNVLPEKKIWVNEYNNSKARGCIIFTDNSYYLEFPNTNGFFESLIKVDNLTSKELLYYPSHKDFKHIFVQKAFTYERYYKHNKSTNKQQYVLKKTKKTIYDYITQIFQHNYGIGNVERVSNIFTIRFPKLTIKNIEKRTHTLQDLFVKFDVFVYVNYNDIEIKIKNFYGTRSTFTKEENLSKYKHSHLNCNSEAANFGAFCMGESVVGQYNNAPIIITDFNTKFSKENAAQLEEEIHNFCIYLDHFLTFEDLDSPHFRISNIGNYNNSTEYIYFDKYVLLQFLKLNISFVQPIPNPEARPGVFMLKAIDIPYTNALVDYINTNLSAYKNYLTITKRNQVVAYSKYIDEEDDNTKENNTITTVLTDSFMFNNKKIYKKIKHDKMKDVVEVTVQLNSNFIVEVNKKLTVLMQNYEY